MVDGGVLDVNAGGRERGGGQSRRRRQRVSIGVEWREWRKCGGDGSPEITLQKSPHAGLRRKTPVSGDYVISPDCDLTFR